MEITIKFNPEIDAIESIINLVNNAYNNITTVNPVINKEEETKEERAEKLFLELMNKEYTIIEENGIKKYFDKDKNLVIEQDNINKEIWFSYWRFWSVFESILGDNYYEIRVFLTGMVERHLNLQGFTAGGC